MVTPAAAGGVLYLLGWLLHLVLVTLPACLGHHVL
jgi:hypothetical protein